MISMLWGIVGHCVKQEIGKILITSFCPVNSMIIERQLTEKAISACQLPHIMAAKQVSDIGMKQRNYVTVDLEVLVNLANYSTALM